MGGHLSYILEGPLAEFAIAESEAAFCESRLEFEVKNVRRTLFGFTLAMVVLPAMDAVFMPAGAVSSAVQVARGLVLTASLTGLWLLHARATRVRVEVTYVAVSVCLAVSLALAAVLHGSDANQPWQAAAFSAAAFVTILPCRLRVGVGAASVVLAAAVGASVVLRRDPAYVTLLIVGTLTAAVCGYAVALVIARLLRRDYMREQQLRTDRTTLEQASISLRMQLMLAQRAHALGILAAGTTHDFNNMLMAIRANALSVRESIAPTAQLDLAVARDASDDILEAVDSASDLSRRLLTFGKPSNVAVGFVNLDQAAQRVVHMIQRLVPKRISLSVELDAGNRLVAMQGAYLEQIVSNLIVNAIEAVPSTGKIEIATTYDERSERVRLRVTDTGVGMSREQLTQVFQPFFTTKATGNGLGLATVKMAVEESDGEIQVESVQGQGTTVSIWLPAAETLEGLGVSEEVTFEQPAVSGFISTTSKQGTA